MPRRTGRFDDFLRWLAEFFDRLFGPNPPTILGVTYLRQDNDMLVYAVRLALDPTVVKVRADVMSAGTTTTVPLVLSTAGDYEFSVSPGPASIAVAGADTAGVWSPTSAATTFTAAVPVPVDNGPPTPTILGVTFLREVPDPTPPAPPAPTPAPFPPAPTPGP